MVSAGQPDLFESWRGQRGWLGWTEALRDRQNIRNIIISYEIIGPPKSL
ncbi:MAG TPA: hypothetical protein VL486_02600 [Verrucomicrobiae bacterium]|nr:hypothetical protein [Verrucomicrobiae bacterium]